ncbi:MAG: 1-acyl-sn-glycerol-3-phosphate acyltransferase [Rhodoferax sp.]|nr:1-acyl-sn-glycerol-3-phosphate acyltransferase [Rhodoferax sp.]
MAEDFPRPHPLQLQGSALAQALFSLLGWRVVFEGLPTRQGVLVVYPHTSNWDFVFLVIAKWAVGLPLKFWVKDSLFKLPLLGGWLRWLGGVPVDRSSAHGIVGSMVQALQQCRQSDRYFWLAVTPEGTRKRTAGWRSGFYQVAKGADVPVGICCVNFPQRLVVVTQFYSLSGDVGADMQRIAQALKTAVGKHPEQAAPIHILEKK